MTLRRNIKAQARLALQGSWGQARLVLLLLLVMGYLINLLDATVMGFLGYNFQYYDIVTFAYSSSFFMDPFAMLFTVLVWAIRLIILAPLGVGMVGWYRELTDRRRQGVSFIFWPYESRGWLRACWLQVQLWLRLLPATLLYIGLPLLVVGAAQLPSLVNTMFYTPLTVGGVLLLLPGALVLLIFSQRYHLCSLLLCEPYSMTVGQAVKTSVRCTRGYCVKLFVLQLSFLPWLLPFAVLAAGYFTSTSALFYNPFSMVPLLLGGVTILAGIITYFKLMPYLLMTQTMYSRYLYELHTHAQSAPQQPAQDIAPTTAAGNGVAWQDIDD